MARLGAYFRICTSSNTSRSFWAVDLCEWEEGGVGPEMGGGVERCHK